MKKTWLLRTIALLMVACLGFALCACAPKAEEQTPAEPAAPAEPAEPAEGDSPAENEAPAEGDAAVADVNGDGAMKIGYAVSSLSESFAVMLQERIVKLFGEKHPDWEVIVQDSNYDVNTELSVTESFIEQNCDVVMWHAVDTSGSAGSVMACNEAGIPAITLINVVDVAEDQRIWIGAQNYDCGKGIAEYVKDKLPQGAKICVLQGPAGTVNSQDRVDGFMENIGRDDIVILDEQFGDWKMEMGLTIMENWLQAYDQIDMVFSCSDTMTPGAIEALKAAGRLDKTMVTSVDCSFDGMTCLANGEYVCDMLYNTDTAANYALEACERLIAGESMTDIGTLTYPFELITPENAQETIDWYFEGFDVG